LTVIDLNICLNFDGKATILDYIFSLNSSRKIRLFSNALISVLGLNKPTREVTTREKAIQGPHCFYVFLGFHRHEWNRVVIVFFASQNERLNKDLSLMDKLNASNNIL